MGLVNSYSFHSIADNFLSSKKINNYSPIYHGLKANDKPALPLALEAYRLVTNANITLESGARMQIG